MKVLFAVNNENISESVIKKYQSMYKEIIVSKNVYYFNAIIKELQKDKTYDRIVVSEDLEPFANKNYDTIDNFIFEKLDKISDEATTTTGEDIPIILIATDRRSKDDAILSKIFGIGVYSALIGQDRSIDEVCKLINKPRTKKEAKIYYKIDTNEVEYKAESEDTVDEVEIQNILTHYKRLGKNEEKYVESFESIAAQYTDEQLRVIIKFLPLSVKAVLEERCPRYQQVTMLGGEKPQLKKQQPYQSTQINPKTKKARSTNDAVTDDGIMIESIKTADTKKITKPVIIPSTNGNVVKKTRKVAPVVQESVKVEETHQKVQEEPVTPVKKGRGRPKKAQEVEEIKEPEKKRRGRPKKVQTEENNTLPGFEEDTQAAILPGFEENSNDTMLPGFEENSASNIEASNNSSTLPGFEETSRNTTLPGFEDNYENITSTNANETNQQNELVNNIQRNSSLENLLTSDKKIVAFVGTTKNGTSFLVNNLAVLLSNKGIKTAILDLTKNKNAYYIYTLNEDALREKSFRCIDGLRSGVADGIQVSKNLTVYTTLPGENPSIDDYENILDTLSKNYSLVLLDCDFDTNFNYFAESHEIYLVQTYDILTIQPLTAFLNELKYKNILNPNKLRIVINKTLKLRKLTDKMVIGGISCYNDPASTYINTLFDKDNVKYTTIPFEDQT